METSKTRLELWKKIPAVQVSKDLLGNDLLSYLANTREVRAWSVVFYVAGIETRFLQNRRYHGSSLGRRKTPLGKRGVDQAVQEWNECIDILLHEKRRCRIEWTAFWRRRHDDVAEVLFTAGLEGCEGKIGCAVLWWRGAKCICPNRFHLLLHELEKVRRRKGWWSRTAMGRIAQECWDRLPKLLRISRIGWHFALPVRIFFLLELRMFCPHCLDPGETIGWNLCPTVASLQPTNASLNFSTLTVEPGSRGLAPSGDRADRDQTI